MTSHRILVGVDGSVHADAAVRWVADHAPGLRSDVVVAYCFEPPVPLLPPAGPIGPFDETWRAQVRDVLDSEWCAPLRDAQVAYETRILMGDPVTALSDYAREHGVDLIVVGRRGRNPMSQLLLGSVSHRLSHHAPCPLVIVPPVAAPTTTA